MFNTEKKRSKTKEVGVARSHNVAANAKKSLDEVAVNKESGRRRKMAVAVAVVVAVVMNVNRHGDDPHKREDHKWIKHHGGQDHKGANDHGHDHKRTKDQKKYVNAEMRRRRIKANRKSHF